MKKFIVLLVLLPVFASFVPMTTHAQTNGKLTGYYYINDPGFASGDVYDVAVRLSTSAGYSSAWIQLPQISYANQPVYFFVPPLNSYIPNIPYPSPVPLGYYSIEVGAVKNSMIGPYYNSSYASPSVIDPTHTLFTADDNPIGVKIP